ncbi:ghrelin O-acyltransferase [Conger conger]|uniref:ghrelin O-acyltransferase n=1 Tax=Conger conger TaxID=82655 RepID=UPI002A5A287F|nr:ghrelin O-acyltransferase [Conger conger]
MDLKYMFFAQHSQLIYQFFSFPIALLYYSLARQRCLSLTSRYIYLMLGGCVLAVVTMGPYCWLVFVPAVASALLVHTACPLQIHAWVFGTQMCWQSFWHLFIQYNEYWLQEPTDNRLLLAVSSLMLLTQRVTSVSMDLQEGKLTPQPSGMENPGSTTPMLYYLSYTLYFPALLGGPLCSFHRFVSFVEQSTVSPPPQPLYVVCWKASLVLGLEWVKYLLVDLIEHHSIGLAHLSAVQGILWVWALSLAFRLSYYSHWALSECLNNAAGLGFRGYTGTGIPQWDGLSDGDPWSLETCSRLSVFARRWNGTTAAWLRRLVFQRCRTAPLLMTFVFSAWWHGLHPGQVLGFLIWGATVKADYCIHCCIFPLLTTPWKQLVYKCLSWMHTQLVIACVVVAVELRSACFMWLFCRTYISAFIAFLYILLLFICYKNTPANE